MTDSVDKGPMCCDACTCTNSHSSKPADQE